MNGPLQRTRTIQPNSTITHGTETTGFNGGYGGNQSGQNGPGGNQGNPNSNPNKYARFEAPVPIPEEEDNTARQGKQEPMMLSIEHYLTILSLFNRFKTKTTVWYDSPDAEKKRDSTRMVQFRLRGNKITAVYEDETTRDVLATEIDVASKFASLFNASEAARLYELTDSGVPLHDAVLKVINETQEDNTPNTSDTQQPISRTISVGGGN